MFASFQSAETSLDPQDHSKIMKRDFALSAAAL
ncbi:hypothetical protein Nmel_005602 [Mimus melanotis]